MLRIPSLAFRICLSLPALNSCLYVFFDANAKSMVLMTPFVYPIAYSGGSSKFFEQAMAWIPSTFVFRILSNVSAITHKPFYNYRNRRRKRLTNSFLVLFDSPNIEIISFRDLNETFFWQLSRKERDIVRPAFLSVFIGADHCEVRRRSMQLSLLVSY